MRALVWIDQDTWPLAVAAAARLPADAEITLLHVAPGDVETLAEGARFGLLGRPRLRPHPRHRGPGPPPPPPSPAPLREISDAEAAALLDEAAAALGRPAALERRRGRVEHEVVDAAAGFDLLVCARDGDRDRPGPHSLAPPGRFVVDHATGAVLLV
jgi:hypothetical protein